ncbi:MAG: hypothetical protein M3R24_39475, partial [Chloroflexota bacterium]|nr:hypothetical protein [Chloroflexota bacterium]
TGSNPAGSRVCSWCYSTAFLRGEPIGAACCVSPNDYKITFLAENFETFIRGLVDDSEFDADDGEVE